MPEVDRTLFYRKQGTPESRLRIKKVLINAEQFRGPQGELQMEARESPWMLAYWFR
jgi:hypothetical protein